MSALFKADSVRVSFRGRVVLNEASVSATPGEVTVLLGRNGSGKTTLFKAALGMLPMEFGSIQFNGDTYLRPGLHHLARVGLFYLPDRGLLSRRRTLSWHLSALGQRFPGSFRSGLPPSLGSQDLMGKTAREISGGEERRAELALAWSRGPSCLLADEPLSRLAPKDQERVVEVLGAMAREGCALVISGHDVSALLELAHQVVWITAGTTRELGTPNDARSHEQFRRDYLGMDR